jgi:hypothetical protein
MKSKNKYQMHRKHQTVQGLVKEECAYHESLNPNNKVSNYCYTGEMPEGECLYFMKNPDNYYIIRCKYFEDCVLPMDSELEAVYYAKIEAENNNKTLSSKDIKKIKEENKVTKTCENVKCQKEFKPSSNRQKFCDKCKKEVVKKKQKEWVKNKRENKKIANVGVDV